MNTVQKIAKALAETEPGPLRTIERVIKVLGDIARKQWNKVKDSFNQHPDDKLIIEGYPVFDKRIGQTGTMTLYAQSMTTKLLEQARREQQKVTAHG